MHLADIAQLNPKLNKSTIQEKSLASFVPMACVSEVSGSIISEEEREIEAVSKGFTYFQNGDILVAKITPCFENGKIALAHVKHEHAFGSTEFHVIRPDATKVDGRYLFHFLRQPRIRIEGEKRMTGSGGQRRVPKSFLEELEIPLPSLPEQRRIAAILDKAEALRSKRHEAIAKLDQLLQSVFLEMFGGDKGWGIQTIGDLAHVQGGLQLSNARSKIETLRPYLRVANVYRNKLELSEIKYMGVTESEFSRTQLRKNDLLIVEGHGNPDEIGRSAVWDDSIVECTHQNHLIRCRIVDEKILPEYLNFYLNSELGRFQLKRSSNTTSGLNTISVSKVREVRVTIPPMDLQKKWQVVQKNIKQMCEVQEEQLSASENLISSLQAQYFH